MTLGELIRVYRSEHNMNMQEFANHCGLSKAYISILERNINPSTGKPPIPSLETIRSIAKTLHMDFNDVIAALDGDQVVLLETSSPLPPNVISMPSTYKVPLLGTIACGQPILAVENAEEVVEVPEHIHADFALRCKGDSMINARIFDGDIVYIHSQPEVEPGQIAAVRVGDEATLKKVYYSGQRLILRAANPLYDDWEYEGSELENVEILGKAVAFTSML